MPVIPLPTDFVGVAEELIESRPGTVFTPDGSRRYTRLWRVLVTNKSLDANQVCKAPGIPRPYSMYFLPDTGQTDFNAVLVNLSARKEIEGEWKSWIVTAEYSDGVVEGGIPFMVGLADELTGFQNQPELLRPVVRWDKDVAHFAPRRDLDGRAYTTSAGQPFSPPYTKSMGRQVLLITRNSRTFSRVGASQYSYAVNSDAFVGADPGTVLCDPLVAEQVFKGTIWFWRITYRLTFNYLSAEDENGVVLETWQPRLLDAGTMRKQNVPGLPLEGRPVNIYGPTGPVTSPVLLDGAGNEQTAVDGGGNLIPVFRAFRDHREMPFNDILAGSVGVIP